LNLGPRHLDASERVANDHAIEQGDHADHRLRPDREHVVSKLRSDACDLSVRQHVASVEMRSEMVRIRV
jgi:hypothetical protein